MSGEYRLLNAECRTRTERLPRIPPRIALWRAAFAVMIWAGATLAAQGITPAVLVGSDLRPHPISLSSLRDGVLSYFDANRDLRREPVDQFVQLRAIGLPAAARADRWSVTLLDLVLLQGPWLISSSIRFHSRRSQRLKPPGDIGAHILPARVLQFGHDPGAVTMDGQR